MPAPPPPPSDPTIDVGVVRALITAQCPEYAGLAIRPVEPGGWDHRTFRLGDERSVRLPHAARYAVQVALGHRWLPRLAPRLPLAIPECHFLGEPGAGFPFPWAVRGWIEGDDARRSPPPDGVAFARTVARFLEALHAIDPAGGPPPTARNFYRGGALSVYEAETLRAIDRLDPTIDGGRARAIWARGVSTRWERPPVWVHGDLAAGNILIRDGVAVAVIDFGNMAVGDPACDLALAWATFRAPERAAFRAALPLDADTWARGRAWALWKALITRAALEAGDPTEEANRVLAEVLSEPV